MLAENLEIARQWVVKAQNDLLNADNNLKAQQISFDAVKSAQSVFLSLAG